jgi:hypothetical protein
VIDEERGVTRGVTFTGIGLAVLLHAATIALVGDPGRASVESVRFLPARNETWLNHVGTATQRAQLPEELSGIDLLARAVGRFRVGGKRGPLP